MPNKTRIPQALVSQSEVDAIALLLDKILPDQPLLKDENIGVQIVSTAGRDNPDHVLCAPTLDALRVALADKFAVWNRDQLIIEFVITNTDGLGLLDDRALIETRCPKSDGSTRRRLVYVWRGHSGYYAWSSFPWDPIHKPCGPLDKMVKIAPPTQEELDTVSQQLETFVTQIIPNHTVDTRKHAVAEYENRMDRARKPFPKLLYSKSTEDIKVKLKCLLDEWHKIDPIAGLRWSVDKHFYPEVGTRCMVFETIPRNNGGAYYRIYFWRLKFGYYSSMSLYLKPKSATNGGCFIATACYGIT